MSIGANYIGRMHAKNTWTDNGKNVSRKLQKQPFATLQQRKNGRLETKTWLWYVHEPWNGMKTLQRSCIHRNAWSALLYIVVYSGRVCAFFDVSHKTYVGTKKKTLSTAVFNVIARNWVYRFVTLLPFFHSVFSVFLFQLPNASSGNKFN